MPKAIVRTFIQLVSAAVLLVVAVLAYCSFAERSAEGKAREFCGALRVGMPVEALYAQAIAAGASERQTKWVKVPYDGAWMGVTFTGALPLSRHVCSVQGSPTLLRAYYVYLD